MVVGLSLVLEGKSSVRDMIQVFEPLEEGNCHTTSIDVEIRDNENFPLDKNLISSRSRGAIGSFSDNFCLFARTVTKIRWRLKGED